MKKEIYIFGSAVRGDVEKNSDIDVLVISDTNNRKDHFPDEWSVYSYKSIREFYESGRLFAWHLHLDSKCIYKKSEKSFLDSLGEPAIYSSFKSDFESLKEILLLSLREIENSTASFIFEVGVTYTAIRDLAMIASTKLHIRPCFSRYSPYQLPLEFPINKDIYELMICARLASTRGYVITEKDKFSLYGLSTKKIRMWLKELEEVL
ncbi:nucleotidyltransferase domain-containing protein [Aeromonas veronii]